MKKSSPQFHELLLGFPAQFKAGLAAAHSATPGTGRWALGTGRTLTIAGMGGSALPGDLLKTLVITGTWRGPHPIILRRDYGLSPVVSRQSLVVCISYSGNTEETLSAYQAARKQKLLLMAITSSGKLAVWAKRDRIPLARIPTGIPPRFAVGVQFGALVGMLVRTGLLPTKAQRETLALSKTLKISQLLPTSYQLRHFLFGRIPVIYASSRLAPIAYSWKTNINENAKVPAFANIFPELNHNEINVFTHLSKKQLLATQHVALVVLEDAKENPRIVKRMRVTASFAKKIGVPVHIEKISGSSPLTRIFRAYLLGLATSGFLAESLGVDPIPVDLIEEFKKRLG